MTEFDSYHGQPVIKPPTWTWEIPYYLFTGGLGGASAGLAYVCQRHGDEELARRAWATALAGVSVSPLLLVHDLGRPMRFLNMLRVIKVTSPMSIGSWILVLTSTAIAPATATAWLGVCPRIGAVAAPAAAVLGLPLATYTAALLAATSVPVWHDARRTMPFVFGAGAALSAGAAALLSTPVAHAAPARRLAFAAALVELAATETMERRVGELGEAYKRGAAHRFGQVARASIATGAAALAAGAGRNRRGAAAAGGLLMLGALCTRWSVFKAGFESVADPAFVVGSQRRRIDRGEDHGARRSTTAASGDPALGTPALPSRSPLREHDLPFGR